MLKSNYYFLLKCIFCPEFKIKGLMAMEIKRNIPLKDKNWFDKDVMFVGGEEGTVTDFLVCGTVLGKDSLLNKLLTPEDYPNWRSKRFSAVINFSVSESILDVASSRIIIVGSLMSALVKLRSCFSPEESFFPSSRTCSS